MTTRELLRITEPPWHVENRYGEYEVWPVDKGHYRIRVAVAERKDDALFIAGSPELLLCVRALADPRMIGLGSTPSQYQRLAHQHANELLIKLNL